ncbi:SHOCT domain-containing protein [Mycobacterium sp.]|uniref:SHOCT domain-containing protein n=1 Tax=Mycobacterium sp. TaxID=1785 RepID=UPI003A86BD3B
MNSTSVARISRALAVVTMVVSVLGLVATLMLDALFFDKYNVYGEIPVPGTGSVRLPTGEATVSLHVRVSGSDDDRHVPVPQLRIAIDPPDGVAQPELIQSIGSTTIINNEAHLRLWKIRVPAEGTYQVTADGRVDGYISPRLAFGHQSSHGPLAWVFAAMFVVGLFDLVFSVKWLGRSRGRSRSATFDAAENETHPEAPATPDHPTSVAPRAAYEPTGERVRAEQLRVVTALRDSGALTESEFKAEKRRILSDF